MITSQGASATSPNLLILGGTTEASALARRAAEAGLRGAVSLAGRVARPARQPLPTRTGGFGGPEGLAAFLSDHAITHLIDATHPFAATMSRNAVEASVLTGVPLIALTRPAWTARPGDDWRPIPDIAAAVEALAGEPRRVMLATGRQHLSDFAVNPQHFYLLRLVDPPVAPLGFPDCHVVVDRGPFTAEGDAELMRDFGIDLVVSKNSGGEGAVAKLTAARALGLPVLMVDRPPAPARRETHDLDAVLDWIAHAGTERGV